MAVTIDEMHVQVESPAPKTSAGKGDSEAKKDVDFGQALTILRERKLRLQAD